MGNNDTNRNALPSPPPDPPTSRPSQHTSTSQSNSSINNTTTTSTSSNDHGETPKMKTNTSMGYDDSMKKKKKDVMKGTTSLLQQEKQSIAYPTATTTSSMGRHKQKTDGQPRAGCQQHQHAGTASSFSGPTTTTASSRIGGGSQAAVFRGIGKNPDGIHASTASRRNIINNHQIQENNPTNNNNNNLRRGTSLRGLGKNHRTSSSRAHNDLLLPRGIRNAELELVHQFTPPYSVVSDRTMIPSPQRDDYLGVGVHYVHDSEDTTSSGAAFTEDVFLDEQQQRQQQQRSTNHNNNSLLEDGQLFLPPPPPPELIYHTSNSVVELPDLDHEGLVEAMPVSGSSAFYGGSSSRRMMMTMTTAQPVEVENQQQQQAARRTAKETKYKCIAYTIVVIAFHVLLISLVVGLTDQEEEGVVVPTTTAPNTTANPTTIMRPLPPMTNLDLLYNSLPDKTKESLYSTDSPQYLAWEWLIHHPNISTYPEWRKEQVFALATIYYSFEGPRWPRDTSPASHRWLDVSTSECDWILSRDEVALYIPEADRVIGPDSYQEEDWQPCNQQGQVQTFVLHQLFLPTNLHPSLPPQIGLLTSLNILGIMFSRLPDNVELASDLLVPELLQLPSLQALNFRGNGAHGTIPPQISSMTSLRHLLIGANALSGTIPSQLALLSSSLEYFGLGDEAGVAGPLPSQLGLMTRLTSLEIYRCSITGTIPTVLGLLTNMKGLALDGNNLVGTIPSALGLLTSSTQLELEQNRLTGSVPTEIGLLSNIVQLELWNNGLTGPVPTELALMTNMIHLKIGNDMTAMEDHQTGDEEETEANSYSVPPEHCNNFTGTFPAELWEFSPHLEYLHLSNLPNLHGQIPSEIAMPNLTTLSLSGSPHFTGTIPDQVCIFVEELDFDCSDTLCGCDCHCQ